MRACRLVVLCALLGLAVSGAQAQNLVTNGDFETGDLTGWNLTETGPSALSEVDAGAGINGSNAVSLGAISPDVDNLSQVLSTQVGQEYTLTFFAQTPEFGVPGGGSPNSLSVYFGGNLVTGPWTVPDSPDNQIDYQGYSYKVTATSSSTELAFVVSNDPDYTQLDNISLVGAGPEVPEPGMLGLLVGSGGSGGLWLLRRRRR